MKKNILEIVFPHTQPKIGKVLYKDKNNILCYIDTVAVTTIHQFLINNNMTYTTEYLSDRTVFYNFI